MVLPRMRNDEDAHCDSGGRFLSSLALQSVTLRTLACCYSIFNRQFGQPGKRTEKFADANAKLGLGFDDHSNSHVWNYAKSAMVRISSTNGSVADGE